METDQKSKKKILFYVPEFPAQTQTFIEREISQLLKRGNLDVWVLSLLRGKGSFSYEPLKDRVIYHRLTVLESFYAVFSLLKIE